MLFLYQPIHVEQEQLNVFYKRSRGAEFLSEDYLKLFQPCPIYLEIDSNI